MFYALNPMPEQVRELKGKEKYPLILQKYFQ